MAHHTAGVRFIQSSSLVRVSRDNIQAYRGSGLSRLILVLSVYPTGDCGKELGHTEAYVVDATTGNIRQHWAIKRLNAYMRSYPEW